MSNPISSYLGLQADALPLREQRMKLIASNLANADTPNYKARDFDFHKALAAQTSKSAVKGGLHATHLSHFNSNINGAANVELEYRIPTQPSVDGNTVDEHKEHAEFMSNSLEFQVAFESQLRKQLRLKVRCQTAR